MKKIESKADHSINSIILSRSSPRAMNGQPLDDETIESLFEAARWAPSAYNSQPWRFIYAKKGTKHFDVFMNLLIEFNQSWCKNAALLAVVISRKTFEHNQNASPTHSYDTGAAWENLALEGASRNLVVHGMSGFNYDKAKNDLNIPDDYEVLAMFAVGHPAPKETLPDALKEREVPSTRKKLQEITMEGQFRG
jgi:nitroreductase